MLLFVTAESSCKCLLASLFRSLVDPGGLVFIFARGVKLGFGRSWFVFFLALHSCTRCLTSIVNSL